MTTLAEIEAAADALPARDQQLLLRYLAARLQAQGASLGDVLPLVPERTGDWMAEDEAAMRRYRPNT